MSEKLEAAIELVYIEACVRFHNKIKAKQDFTKEAQMCDAIEVMWPDIVQKVRLKSA